MLPMFHNDCICFACVCVYFREQEIDPLQAKIWPSKLGYPNSGENCQNITELGELKNREAQR